MSIMWHIRNAINNDDEDDSDYLIDAYDSADEAGKKMIDRVLVAVCGYGYATLLEKSKDDDDYDDPDDDGDALASAGHGTDEDYGSASEML